MEVPKPKRLRSRKTIEEVRAIGYCQICGAQKGLEVHHIRTRGAGGGDERENLVCLCNYHHRLVQDGLIQLDDYELITGDIPGYDDLMQRALDCIENEQNSRWTLGAICSLMVNIMSAKRGDLAAMFNCSSQYISELMRTWAAFPTEEMRVPDLSWQHHRLAARTDDPSGWIDRTVDNEWSTRELTVAIKAAKDGEKPEEEAAMERARRALNLVSKIMNEDDEAAHWLAGQLISLCN